MTNAQNRSGFNRTCNGYFCDVLKCVANWPPYNDTLFYNQPADWIWIYKIRTFKRALQQRLPQNEPLLKAIDVPGIDRRSVLSHSGILSHDNLIISALNTRQSSAVKAVDLYT